MTEQDLSLARKPRFLPAALAGWLAYLAIDFLTHAVFLAAWWRSTEQYWLPPEDLFRAIPFGYASFAIYCAAITWLLWREGGGSRVEGGVDGSRVGLVGGLRLGAIGGLIYGVVVVLGVYSVLPLPISALVVWPVSFLAASSAAGAAAGWVLAAERPWRRVELVLGAALAVFIIGVVLQNVLFPTPNR